MSTLSKWSAISNDGIVSASPRPETKVIGINRDGELYFYGETPSTPGDLVEAVCGLIVDVQVVERGQNSSYGPRNYLDVRIQAPDPTVNYLLRLPANNGQYAYRSLLGALQQVRLHDTAVKIEPIHGRVTTFLQVSLDPRGLDVVKAESIGPDEADLRAAVAVCQENLVPAQTEIAGFELAEQDAEQDA